MHFRLFSLSEVLSTQIKGILLKISFHASKWLGMLNNHLNVYSALNIVPEPILSALYALFHSSSTQALGVSITISFHITKEETEARKE